MTPLLILVGLTGCGKTTAVHALRSAGLPFTLLPNRRELTDQIIIPTVQKANAEPLTAVTDRTARFAITRRYRELHPGGMAHALAQWQESGEPVTMNGDLHIFDGLRGENEVAHAAGLLPQAWFLFLDAPDFVRVQRLLGRGDAFDVVTVTSAATADGATAVPPELHHAHLTIAEQEQLLHLVAQGQISRAELIAKLTIVNSERQNYDPAATLAALRQHAPERLIYADTVQYTPAEIAQLVQNGLSSPPA